MLSSACGASAPIDIEVDGRHLKKPRLTAGFFVFADSFIDDYVVTHDAEEMLGTAGI